MTSELASKLQQRCAQTVVSNVSSHLGRVLHTERDSLDDDVRASRRVKESIGRAVVGDSRVQH